LSPCTAGPCETSPIDRNLMRMYVDVILAVAVVIIAFLLYMLDRSLKVIREARRRRDLGERLTFVVEQAEAAGKRREAAAEASAALTSVLPAIKRPEDQGPRSVA
jgi:hypothetical protein